MCDVTPLPMIVNDRFWVPYFLSHKVLCSNVLNHKDNVMTEISRCEKWGKGYVCPPHFGQSEPCVFDVSDGICQLQKMSNDTFIQDTGIGCLRVTTVDPELWSDGTLTGIDKHQECKCNL